MGNSNNLRIAGVSGANPHALWFPVVGAVLELKQRKWNVRLITDGKNCRTVIWVLGRVQERNISLKILCKYVVDSLGIWESKGLVYHNEPAYLARDRTAI